MAIKDRKELNALLNKTANEGETDQGRLTALDWNSLVDHVIDTQAMANGAIKGIKYNVNADGTGGQIFSEIDAQGYLKMTVADTTGYNLEVNITERPDEYVAIGGYCPIRLNVSHKKIEGDDYISAVRPCIVNLYLNDSNNAFYTANLYDKGSTSSTALKELFIDLSTIPGLSSQFKANEEENTIKIEVNNQEGTIKNDYCVFRSVGLGLRVYDLDTKKVYTENNPPKLVVRVTGVSDPRITVEVDNKPFLTNQEINPNIDNPFDIFDSVSVNTHGIHTLKVFASVVRSTQNGDIVIETPVQSFDYIYGAKNDEPIVMAVINNTEPVEYSNFVMTFIAYKYNDAITAYTDNINISLREAIYDNNGLPTGDTYIETIQEAVFDSITKSCTGEVIFSLFPVGTPPRSLKGKKAVVLTIGNNTDSPYIAEIEVKESTIKLEQQAGYAVYLTANNRSNSESIDTLRTWKSEGKDESGSTLRVNAEFNDDIEFINTGSGWIADSDGNMAMHLRKGRYFTLIEVDENNNKIDYYQPFKNNPTFSGTGSGKTISIEFATRNCVNQHSPVISCLTTSDNQERGFEITASKAYLKSNTFDMNIDFKEDTRIKIDFVIEGRKTDYSYNTIIDGEASEGISSEALAIIYVDGVYQGLRVIPENTTFKQIGEGNNTPKILFGSEDCDLDIYSIRVYNTALLPTQIIKNYSYDTPNFVDKINIALRNDIFDDKHNSYNTNKPNINISKLRNARPELPFFYVQNEINTNTGTDSVIPSDKENWQKLTFSQWANPMNENDKSEAAISWTTEKGRWRNQGTSSLGYPWPWRNWDWQLKYDKDAGEIGFTFGDKSTGGKWAQYKGMADAGSIKKITLKKDYASSEMCNNAITSEYFTDMALAIGNDFPGVLSPAQRVHGARSTPYRLTFVATPCFLFQQFNNNLKQGTAGEGFEALGMMNLIPNKNECDYLGFTNDFIWDPAKDKRAQSWELTENNNEWFWYKKLEGIKYDEVTRTFTNDLAKCYEARYPKDTTVFKNSEGKFDGDFGMMSDSMNISDMVPLSDEQKDIIEFHNWLVDVNRQIPEDYKAVNPNGEYAKFDSAVTFDFGNKIETYTHDTPEYRLAKFKAEAPTRLIIDQFLLYYIWREQFWAFDSGFKNLQIYTMGRANNDVNYMQWGCMVRDADTTLGIENTGKNIFPPHLEDIDYYVAEKDENGEIISDVTFVYGGAKDKYHSKEIPGHAVLNGQFGSLWVNLRDAYSEEITTMYRALANTASANWKDTLAINRFRKHQEKWCENLYNFGMRQYFGGGPFTKWISSGLGDKKNSRAAWLERGFYYRNSKYKNLSDHCQVRACCYDTPDKGILEIYPYYEKLEDGTQRKTESTAAIPLQLKTYIPMYIGFGAQEAKMSACENFFRITDTQNTFGVPAGNAGFCFPTDESADVNSWFYGTKQITELGDLARCCKIKIFAEVNLPKLKELNLGHEKERDNKVYKEYYNDGTGVRQERDFTNPYLGALDCSKFKQLTLLDITNHTALGKDSANTLDLSYCDQLKKLYAKGTDTLWSINLPATTSLETIYLGKNLTVLKLINLTGIKTFKIEGLSKIEQLEIRNCGNTMMSSFVENNQSETSYTIVSEALSSLESKSEPKCILEGVNWTNVEVSVLERLLNINATISGKIAIIDNEENIINNELKVKLVNKYGNIDDKNNGLYITYKHYEIKGAYLPSKFYIYEPGTYPLQFDVTPDYANTYSSATWEFTSNTPYASIDTNTGVITRYDMPAVSNDSTELKVTIKQIPDANGNERDDIIVQSTVYFYERIARPGDIVFNDGSFSDEIDNSKTPIGLCFYVDPNNKYNRLMCALKPIQCGTSKDVALLNWGAHAGFTVGATNYGPSPDLRLTEQEDPNYNCFNIAKLRSISTISYPNPAIYNIFKEDIYRDDKATDNDKFKKYELTHLIGNIGWIYSENNINIDGLSNESGVLSISKDENVPIGYYNTLAIIEHRNRLLDSYFEYKGQTNAFARPTKTANKTEFENLKYLINSSENYKTGGRVNNKYANWNSGGSQLYYPAASLCFSYSPIGVNNLHDKFKQYNWFLPSSGELIRILYYIYQCTSLPYKTDHNKFPDALAFQYAKNNDIINLSNFYTSNTMMDTSINQYWSSSQAPNGINNNPNGGYAADITIANDEKQTGNYNTTCWKSQIKNVIPVCKF